MPGTDWRALAEELQHEGLSPQLPCVIVSHASCCDEKVVFSTIDKLGLLAGIAAPSLLLVGEAVAELPSAETLVQPVELAEGASKSLLFDKQKRGI